MSAGEHQYPRPREDLDNRKLLQGWREGRLLLQRCRGCGRAIFYSRPLCPHCWSTELAWEQASGRGKVVSFSLVHRPNDPAFFAEAPIILAEIMFEEKVTMIGRVIAAAPAVAPIVVIIAVSFNSTALFTFPPPHWSTRWYESLWDSRSWREAGLFSIGLASAVALAALALGVPAAYGLSRDRFRGHKMLWGGRRAAAVFPHSPSS
jgi:uncharacterized OB-fold protein